MLKTFLGAADLEEYQAHQEPVVPVTEAIFFYLPVATTNGLNLSRLYRIKQYHCHMQISVEIFLDTTRIPNIKQNYIHITTICFSVGWYKNKIK